MRFFLMIFSILMVLASQAQSPQVGGQQYIVKEGERLAQIAKEYLGKRCARKKIVKATNLKAATDEGFESIARMGKLQAGQLLWIPSQDSEEAPNTNSQEATIVEIPQTDCEIRIWYNYQVVAISVINEYWIEQGLSLEERAKAAYEIRHQARINARYMMQDKTAVEMLRKRDKLKYGNPDGPTFDYLLEKNLKKGLAKEKAYESIIQSASKTSTVFNKDCVD